MIISSASSDSAAQPTPAQSAPLWEADDDLDGAEPMLSPAAAHNTTVHTLTAQAQHHGQRLDRVLAQLLPDSSRSFLQQLIDGGEVLLSGQPIGKAAARIRAGDTLTVHLRPLPQDTAFHADATVLPQFTIIYVDAHLMVINKAAGLVVHPAAGNWSATLLNGLLAHHPCHALLPRAGIVHRLDKDTSGLMVVARTREAMDALIRMIAARQVKRQYLALAHYPWQGMPERQVSQPIGRDPRHRQRMAVVDLAQYPGKEAITDFELLANSNPAAQSSQASGGADAEASTAHALSADGFCLLRCSLHSGRTHQIRVHAAYVHHPLIADVLYGGGAVGGLERQALHAERLAFEHPITGEALSFRARLPEDMRRACDALGISYNAD